MDLFAVAVQLKIGLHQCLQVAVLVTDNSYSVFISKKE